MMLQTDYIIASTGSTIDFGDLTMLASYCWYGANPLEQSLLEVKTSIKVNEMEFVTIATRTDAQDFGDLSSR